jgi:hypothetical protein
MLRLDALSATDTDATGGKTTFAVVLELTPSLVAWIVVEPTVMAVTRPVLETLATAVLLLFHVTTRSVTTVPSLSRTVALSWRLEPAMIDGAVGDNAILPTGTGATTTGASPVVFDTFARTRVEPRPLPRKTPLLVMEAIVESSVLHATVRPVSTVPPASVMIVLSCVDRPLMTLMFDGEMVTLATELPGMPVVSLGFVEVRRPSLEHAATMIRPASAYRIVRMAAFLLRE